jgi:ribosomal protein L9
MIAEAIKTQCNIALPLDSIKLSAPIKNVGSIEAHVTLGKHHTRITIEIVPEK